MRRKYFLFQKEDDVSAKYSNLRMNYFTSDMFFNKPPLNHWNQKKEGNPVICDNMDELEGARLSEINHKEKEKYYRISHVGSKTTDSE